MSDDIGDDVADSARENLDDLIAIATQDATALRHLAGVMAHNKRKHDPDTDSMIGSLIRAAKQLEQHRKNLEEVRAIYDAKVNGEPVAG